MWQIVFIWSQMLDRTAREGLDRQVVLHTVYICMFCFRGNTNITLDFSALLSTLATCYHSNKRKTFSLLKRVQTLALTKGFFFSRAPHKNEHDKFPRAPEARAKKIWPFLREVYAKKHPKMTPFGGSYAGILKMPNSLIWDSQKLVKFIKLRSWLSPRIHYVDSLTYLRPPHLKLTSQKKPAKGRVLKFGRGFPRVVREG